LNNPLGGAVDSAGNLYIADYLNNRVRMVSAATGVITTVAGTGTAGYSGDGGPAASAELNTPHDVVVDAADNLYIADWGNNRVRRVNAATGLITTVVGTGTAVYNGDNIVATSADLNPLGMVFDNVGNLYIADYSNARIRKVDVSVPPSLTFATTNVGSVSAAQDVIVENLGNAALNISQISTAANFSLGSPDTTCSSNSQVLSPAASCILGFEFAPSTAGPINGNVMLTDNALNVSGATQQIPLSGTGQSTITSYTLSLTELGTGTGTVTDNSSPTPLINCSESNGVVTGTCSASYASGTTLVLTASPNSSPAFGGWSAPPCTVTASNRCSVVMNANQSITADFVAPPASVTLQFTPGTNVTQMAAFCPNNSNPCTDPNADALTLTIPQVTSGFSLTVMHTAIVSDGLCPPSGTVLTDFACRLVSFFNYGTDPNGNTIVPLCDPYANGNCVHYLVYSGTPGTEPPTTSYSGGVYWKIGYNNATFVPPGPYWTGAVAPRMLDDPDVDQFSPPLPYGTNCSTPMQVGTPPRRNTRLRFTASSMQTSRRSSSRDQAWTRSAARPNNPMIWWWRSYRPPREVSQVGRKGVHFPDGVIPENGRRQTFLRSPLTVEDLYICPDRRPARPVISMLGPHSTCDIAARRKSNISSYQSSPCQSRGFPSYSFAELRA
jgi:hypothetical protein